MVKQLPLRRNDLLECFLCQSTDVICRHVPSSQNASGLALRVDTHRAAQRAGPSPVGCLEPLQKCDQGVLISIGQARLSARELVCAEIVASIDNQIRAFAELKKRVYQVGENLSDSFVTRPLR